MIEVADILRLHGLSYQQTHRLSPGEHKVLRDLIDCRTAQRGGHLYRCDRCAHPHYTYHSCQNRHCPKCQGQRTTEWLQNYQDRLLPTNYFLLTFTLPQPLRALARTHPKRIYSLLMSAAAAALQKLAWDPRYVGGQLSMLAVLHTWTRAMLYHPHVHLLVTAGGLTRDGQRWVRAANPAFLVPCFALSKIFRGKFQAGLKKAGLLHQLPPSLWKQKWVVHAQPAGNGRKVLDYVGRYVFRIAISNSRLEAFHNGQVRFRYRDNRTQQLRHISLPAQEFIRRFLLHLLPKGFVKVRSYGLWSSRNAEKLQRAKTLLHLPPPQTSSQDTPSSQTPQPNRLCPHCKIGHLILIDKLAPQSRWPP